MLLLLFGLLFSEPSALSLLLSGVLKSMSRNDDTDMPYRARRVARRLAIVLSLVIIFLCFRVLSSALLCDKAVAILRSYLGKKGTLPPSAKARRVQRKL